MSLYNQLHGQNPDSAILCSWFNIDQGDNSISSGRFRDIYLADNGTKVILYTRNGGGNREAYQEVNDTLAKHPDYVRDWDDDFDNTYAYFEFNVPAAFKRVAKLMWKGEEPKTISEKFQATMNEMDGMTPEQVQKDPRFAPTFKIIKQIEEGDTPADGVFHI